MAGHGARCEGAGGAPVRPCGLNRLGGPTAATAMSSRYVACGAHPRLLMRQGAAAARPRQPGQGRVLHCVPAQASKLAWVPRAAGCRDGAHDGGEMGLRRIAKE
jgi:hypothetical protein